MYELEELERFIRKVLFRFTDGKDDNFYEFTLFLEGRNELVTLYTEQPRMAFFIVLANENIFPCAPIVFDDSGLFIESLIIFKQENQIKKLNFLAVLSEYDYPKFKMMHEYIRKGTSEDLLNSIKYDG